jgi:hypothetical protein
MLERQIINNRHVTVQYLTRHFEATDRQHCHYVRVKYQDTGKVVYVAIKDYEGVKSNAVVSK